MCFFFVMFVIAAVDLDPNRAPECDTNQCTIPDCFCSADGTRIPNNIEPTQVPQMVTLTFNGAVNVDNIDLYEEIFNGNRQNPNGCQIKGTFFVSHKYSNYAAIQELHRKDMKSHRSRSHIKTIQIIGRMVHTMIGWPRWLAPV